MWRNAAVVLLLVGCHQAPDLPPLPESTCAPTATPNYTPDPDKWDVSWLWTQLEPELDPSLDDAARAEAIARWVARSSVNDKEVAADQGFGERLRAIPFYGLCGERSVVTKQLAHHAGLRAEVFNIYNFIKPGSGHTAVQFCYDDAWHFYDVTYAGVFVADDRVLSFEEVRAEPERAMSGLVPFETGFDIYQSEGTPGPEVFEARMLSYYSVESLRSSPSLSFYGSGEPVPLNVAFDLSELPIVVGEPGATRTEIHWSGADQRISERMGVMLGHVVDNFQPQLQFTHVEVGATYTLTFHIDTMTSEGLEFALYPIGADLLGAETLVTSDALEDAEVWILRFTALREDPTIAIEHDLPFREGLVLDWIELTRD